MRPQVYARPGAGLPAQPVPPSPEQLQTSQGQDDLQHDTGIQGSFLRNETEEQASYQLQGRVLLVYSVNFIVIDD